jgi:hypothetical protein
VIISNEMKDETELMNTKIIQSNCSSKKEIKVSFMTSLDYNMCAHVYFLLLSYSVMDNLAQYIYIYPPLAFLHYQKNFGDLRQITDNLNPVILKEHLFSSEILDNKFYININFCYEIR